MNRGRSSALTLLLPLVLGTLAVALEGACSSQADVKQLDTEALADPEACRSCHATAVREWEGSMHAYAADDPVFVAMNARMLREAKDVPSDTCTKCHAPVASRRGLLAGSQAGQTASLSRKLKGVTCLFCHTVDAVTGAHDAAVSTSSDGVLRAGLQNPMSGAPHASAYSSLHDREAYDSSSTCGACHDVTTPSGLAVERTYAEWQASLYSQKGQLSCGKCHMEGRDGQAAEVPGAPIRRVHDHSMPGVDVALTPFPSVDEQTARVRTFLDNTLLSKLCVRPSKDGVDAEVTLDNAFAGHGFPSGATHDRRVWVELVAENAQGTIFTSGRVPNDTSVTSAAERDPNLWWFGETLRKKDGQKTLFLWDATAHEGLALPPAVTTDRADPRFVHSLTKAYPIPGLPTAITAKVFVRPVDLDVLSSLVASGDLDPAVVAKMPTFEIRTAARQWTSALGFGCTPP